MAGELGVERLVGAVRPAQEEVGHSAPPVRDERALVDDLDSVGDRLPRRGRTLFEAALLRDDAHDLALGLEPREVGMLVRQSLVEDELRLLGRRTRVDLASGDAEQEGGQVLAGEVRGDVARREQDAAVLELHRLSIAP